jgi:formylglycine-generating enzyme required for sulfatase activity
MKKVFLSIYAFISACLLLQGQDKKDIRALSDYLAEMVLIPKDNYYPRVNSFDLEATDRDSLLILTYNPARVDVTNFMISNHEVTNFEYYQFIDWIKDSLISKCGMKEINAEDFKYPFLINNESEISIKVYPDTSVWINDFTYSFNEPLKNLYFNHIAYKNYPVVGISYNQANAYINWLNKKLRTFLKEHHFKQNLCCYRLPTEIEWQYAAYGHPIEIVNLQGIVYPWSGSLFNKDGKFKANFGSIFDKNSVGIKGFCDDGYCTTSPVKSFDANYFGLYDMAGNVSEWVSDTIDIQKFENKLSTLLNIFIPDNVAVTIKK